MSNEQTRVACLLLQENFGDLVEQIGCYLLKHGACSLDAIVKGTDLKQNQVKKSLCVLIQHHLVSCESQSKLGGVSGQPAAAAANKSVMLYSARVEHILWRVRFPRYIHAAKAEFGDFGEVIVEDILQQGRSLMSECVQRVCERIEAADVVETSKVGELVKEKFVALVEGRFLERVNPLNQLLVIATHGEQEAGGITKMALDVRFDLPPSIDAIKYDSRKRKRASDSNGDEPQAKKSKKESKEPVDAGVQWRVNFDRFHQHFRDKAIVSAVMEKIDETAALVMGAALSVSSILLKESTMKEPTSPELYMMQIADALPKKLRLSRSELEQYLKVLADDEAQFLHKTGDSGGGSYTVSYRHSSEVICRASIESIIKERFGSKCFRVFRLLLLKRMLEQKQVADMAMIPSKEAKELLYILMAENYVTLQEIPRTPDYAPSRTFYLFSVHLPHVTRMVVERCYKALGNLISRRATETKDNKRLLERDQMYERQLAEAGGEGAGLHEEMEEVLTPDEREKVTAIKRNVAKLEQAEIQLDETIEVISDYITFQSTIPTTTTKKKKK